MFDFEKDEKCAEALRKHVEKQEKEEEWLINREHISVMEKLFVYVSENEEFCDDNMLYNKEKYNFSFEEFSWLFSRLHHYAELDRKLGTFDDEEFDNECFIVKYKERFLIFETMSGQGTINTCQFIEQDDMGDMPFIAFEVFQEEIMNKTLLSHKSSIRNIHSLIKEVEGIEQKFDKEEFEQRGLTAAT